MKILAISMGFAAVLLAGCGGDGNGAPASPSPSTPTERFLALVHTAKYQDQGGLARYGRAQLVNAAKLSCSQFGNLENEKQVSEATSSLVRTGDWEAPSAAAVLDAAKRTYC